LKILDAILATSAAPTYFPIHTFDYQVEGGHGKVSCVDGGVWGNDPRLFGLFSQRIRNASERNYLYNVLSFGTGKVKENKPMNKSWDDTIGWLGGTPNIIDVMFSASSSQTERMFEHMTKTGLVRSVKLQVLLDDNIALDDVNSINNQRMAVEKMCADSMDNFDLAIRLTMFMGLKMRDETKVSILPS